MRGVCSPGAINRALASVALLACTIALLASDVDVVLAQSPVCTTFENDHSADAFGYQHISDTDIDAGRAIMAAHTVDGYWYLSIDGYSDNWPGDISSLVEYDSSYTIPYGLDTSDYTLDPVFVLSVCYLSAGTPTPTNTPGATSTATSTPTITSVSTPTATELVLVTETPVPSVTPLPVPPDEQMAVLIETQQNMLVLLVFSSLVVIGALSLLYLRSRI